MRFSRFKKLLNEKLERPFSLVIDLKDLDIIPAPYDGKIKLVRDERTKWPRGGDYIFKVHPIAFDRKCVAIVCPYCGEIHIHGGTKDDYKGPRTAHCTKGPGRGQEYELV